MPFEPSPMRWGYGRPRARRSGSGIDKGAVKPIGPGLLDIP